MSAIPTFTCERERKNFSAGIALANRKIQGHHLPTPAEREAATAARGRAEVLKKLGAAGYRRCFGTEPPTTTTPATSTRKSYSDPTTSQRKLHRYVNRNWLTA